MTNTGLTLSTVFNIIGMAMAAVTIAFVAIGAGDAGTYAIFLAIGLFSLAAGSIRK